MEGSKRRAEKEGKVSEQRMRAKMKPAERQHITMGYLGLVQKWKTWTSIPG